MGRRTIGILVGLLLATTGTVLLVLYVGGAENRALQGQRVIEVLVADVVIPRGTPATELDGLVRPLRVPEVAQVPGSLNDLGALDPQTVATVDILPGEQLTVARFLPASELNLRGGVDLPEGLQELTLALAAQRVVGGSVAAGDLVGVVASFDGSSIVGAPSTPASDVPEDVAPGEELPDTTSFLLHKILVTQVSGGSTTNSGLADAGEQAPQLSPEGTIYVTLALDAPQVERTVFAAEFGRLWLTAEPDNAVEDGTKPRTRGNVFP
jgi:pilus assembly protein CpaB